MSPFVSLSESTNSRTVIWYCMLLGEKTSAWPRCNVKGKKKIGNREIRITSHVFIKIHCVRNIEAENPREIENILNLSVFEFNFTHTDL